MASIRVRVALLVQISVFNKKTVNHIDTHAVLALNGDDGLAQTFWRFLLECDIRVYIFAQQSIWLFHRFTLEAFMHLAFSSSYIIFPGTSTSSMHGRMLSSRPTQIFETPNRWTVIDG